MKSKYQKMLPVAVFLIILFSIYRYWDWGEGMLNTFISAVSPFVFGGAIAYIVNILMSFYESTIVRFVKLKAVTKNKRGISILLAFGTFFGAIYILLSIVIPELISSITQLLSVDFTQVAKNILANEWVEKAFGQVDLNTVTTEISTYMQQILSSVSNILLGMLKSVTTVFSAVLTVIMGLIFSLYLLGGKEELSGQVHTLLATYVPKWHQKIAHVVRVFNRSFNRFIIGQTLEACILGTMCYIGMLILNVPYASTTSVLVGATAIIPVVGAYIGVVIGSIMIMTQSVPQALVFLIFIVLLQQFEGNVIYPRVVGGSIGLPGMWVIVAVTVGSSLYGIVGMLIGVPVAAALYQLLKEDIHRRKSKQARSVSDDKSIDMK